MGRFVTPQQTDAARAVYAWRFHLGDYGQPHLRRYGGGQRSSTADKLLTDGHRDGRLSALSQWGRAGKIDSQQYPPPDGQRGARPAQ
ncbi:hypothetical protein EYF80_000250 [Liparis tanakae]|uniref:Uncharacterized protein n=1 Tax=Liparis tanakae TaxID=230148 RepID=A0A4Z2JI47_9TELE|nr:hypothetical protein EYF80_000250 [Liparis tanakae]